MANTGYQPIAEVIFEGHRYQILRQGRTCGVPLQVLDGQVRYQVRGHWDAPLPSLTEVLRWLDDLGGHEPAGEAWPLDVHHKAAGSGPVRVLMTATFRRASPMA
jgi:hypothetical protein